MNGKTVFRRAAVTIGGTLVVLRVAAIVLIHAVAFQHFVLERIEQKAQASLGARLNIERMAINWRLFTFDFYGITLHGKESSSQAPLFVADHLRVGLKILSILRREVDLNEIVLDQPIAHLNIDRDGISNLPQSPSTFPQPLSTINNFLDLAIHY